MIDHNKINRTIAFLKKNAYPFYANEDQDMYSHWQDELYRALFHSLPMAELEQVKEMLDSGPECPRTLYYKASGVLKSRREAAMTAIDTTTLLGWYADKKSGKVNLSIKSLMLSTRRKVWKTRR